MTEKTQRRLAAIVSADVVEYSRLMGEGEARTLDALRTLRDELFGPAVASHLAAIASQLGLNPLCVLRLYDFGREGA